MRKFIIAALALSIATPALADGPYNWNGVYIGAHGGVITSGDAIYTYTEAGNFEPADRPRPTDFDDEAVYGIHGGYLFQLGQAVLGIEGSATFNSASGELLENPPPTGNDYQTKSDAGNIYVLTGRLGYAFDRLMIYGKAGYAWSDVDFEASFFNKDGEGGSNGSKVRISNNFNFDGPVYGGGVEFALTQNITFGAEWLRHDFGSSDVETLTTTNSGITTEKVKASNEIDTITGRLNFKFN